jgi:hypothetical protein
VKHRFLIASVVVVCAALLASAALGGFPAAMGMLLGIVCGIYGVFTLYWTVALLKGSSSVPGGTAFVLFAFFLKFPLIGLGGYLAYRLGMVSIEAFLVGIVMVYFALVWRAARSDLYSH